MQNHVCAFTGHRPKSFPWGYDENDDRCINLKEIIAQQIRILVKKGYTDYLSGMALGADVWCAQAVLALRDKEPRIKLHCILPCRGQEQHWSDDAKALYYSIIKQADSRVYANLNYYKNCMLDRNKFLVDYAGLLFAVYNGTSSGGTAFTVDYARKQGKEIMILDPLTQKVFTENIKWYKRLNLL